ncbi:helix-turn-helix transcriptional regulator [Pseudomonas sp. TNT2022 ID357]|uniref:Helix-turn-helix transcriptional regulator n=1 Tax=Pseudomonas idahonensis TaxID=2942628 RepID=A0ABT5Q8A6_9PSED|nr:helix-turn-helix transcriptional regulator [Pseudomonas idahonensis]MDD1150373.1 helix-turn-helix transcriptional regulator [Pseudomonas idahonensis]
MTTISQRLKLARKHARLTQKALAEKVGVEQPVISQLETGRSQKSAFIYDIAVACGVSPAWLSHGSGDMLDARNGPVLTTFADSNAELIGDISAWDEDDPLDEDDVEVPYFAEVEFAGGNGMTEVVEMGDRKLRFSATTLRAAGVSSQGAACARVKGKSMERLILDGAAIGFDMHDTNIHDGEIYAFNHGGMLRVKYLYRLPGGAIRIRSENDDEYPDEVMSAKQWHDEVRMLGRVFWWSTVRRSPKR